MKEQKYIGIFDSGVGGLSVLTRLLADFPNESFIYLGDTARLPYGTKSKDTIKKYVQRNVHHLISNYPIKIIVVACNSASSVLSDLNLPVKTIGVIKAGANTALSQTKTNHIALWATRTTTLSNEYENEILNLKPEVKLTSISCPTLVTLVEENINEHPLLSVTFDHYLTEILKNPLIDTLILGCTHFHFFKKALRVHLDKKNLNIKLTDALEEISINLNRVLKGEFSSSKKIEDLVLVTDDADHFKGFISNAMPKNHTFSFKKIDL